MGVQFILHTITAFCFACGVAVYIRHYHLLEFPHAPLLSFVFVFVGYMFLSRKYDPSLTVLFLVLSGFVFYRAISLPEKKSANKSREEIITQKLSVLCALVGDYKIRTGKLPKDLSELTPEFVCERGFTCHYCVKKDCAMSLTKENPGLYFIWMRDMSDDKDKNIWYVDDSFRIFSRRDSE